MIVIGIDPGLSGAIAILGEVARVHAVPTISLIKRARKRPKGGGKAIRSECHYDMRAIYEFLLEVAGAERVHVFREYASPRPDNGPIQAFRSGIGYGAWEMVCAVLGFALTDVPPRVWQKVMYRGVGGIGKDRSVLAAKRLFPTVSLLRTDRSRVADHNYADALLIAAYGRSTLSPFDSP